MVDIVNRSLGVNKLNEILDNLGNILICENTEFRISVEAEFLVKTITADDTQIVSLFGEEQLVDHVSRGCLIRWF